MLYTAIAGQLRALGHYFRATFEQSAFQHLPSLRQRVQDSPPLSVADLKSLLANTGPTATEYFTIYQEHEYDESDIELADVGYLRLRRFVRLANILPELIREGVVKPTPVLTPVSDQSFLGRGSVELTETFHINGRSWFVDIYMKMRHS